MKIRYLFFCGLGIIGMSGCAATFRLQTPKDRPYQIQTVEFVGGSPAVRLAGELTKPFGDGPFPAVILLTGSGPHDRDETILGHKPFLVIADHLSRNGFAVLRYDDRGVGESTGNFKTADKLDFAKDAAVASHWLRMQPSINREKIGFLVHSKGGYIAPLAAMMSPTAFMVFLAVPGKPILPDVMITQTEDVLRSRNKPVEAIAKIDRQYRELTAILRKSKNADDARNRLIPWMEKEAMPQKKRKAVLAMWATRWGIGYADYDPLPALRSFKNPVLALFGGKDLQVSAKENAATMGPVLTHPDSKICIIADMNHLFQKSKTGKVGEYALNDVTIDPGVLDKISNWLTVVTEDKPETSFECGK